LVNGGAERSGGQPAGAAEALGDLLRPADVVLIKGRSTQKLERIYLALSGRRVGCDIELSGLA
jgi:UDP-N-acetylmuramyl pentapeptide synthase